MPGVSRAQEPQKNLSVSEAAQVLAKRRHDRNPPPVTTEGLPPVDESEQLETESDQPESESVEPTEFDDAQPDNEESPEEDQPEGDEESNEPQTMIVAGQELSQAEIEEGFLRHDDYTRKTQHVAQREQEVNSREEYYATRLGQIDGMLRQGLDQYNNVNWPALAQQDMNQYNVLSAQKNEAQRQFDAHQTQVNEFFSQVEERKTAERTKKAEESTAELRRAFNGRWDNARYYDLIDFMSSSYAISREDLLSETNPLLFRMAAEAQAYRNAKTVKPTSKVKRSGKRVPNSRRATTDGRNSTQQSKGARQANTAMSDLQKDGSVDAAALAFAARRHSRGSR
jgi:hypothetical protein